MDTTKFFITSYHTRLRIKDMQEISKVERGWGECWWFRIEMYPLTYDTIFHNSEYRTEFEAKAVREALQHCMHSSEHFITSYRVRLKVTEIKEVSKVELYKDGHCHFVITMRPRPFDREVIYHHSIYTSEFEARAIREVLHARL